MGLLLETDSLLKQKWPLGLFVPQDYYDMLLEDWLSTGIGEIQ